MKLKAVINLNMDMAPQPAAVMAVLGGITAVVIGARIYATLVGLAIYMIILTVFMVFAMISLRHVFSHSMFGAEAYRYMVLPISFRQMVTGKICIGAVHCCAVCLMMMLLWNYCLIYYFGVGGSEFRDGVVATAAALIHFHNTVSDGVITTNSVVLISGATPVAALLDSFFISAMVLFAVIIRNLLDPQRSSPQTAVAVAIAAILIYVTANIVFLWLPGLFFKNDLAFPQLIIAVLLKTAATGMLARGAARLLEKKYALH